MSIHTMNNLLDMVDANGRVSVFIKKSIYSQVDRCNTRKEKIECLMEIAFWKMSFFDMLLKRKSVLKEIDIEYTSDNTAHILSFNFFKLTGINKVSADGKEEVKQIRDFFSYVEDVLRFHLINWGTLTICKSYAPRLDVYFDIRDGEVNESVNIELMDKINTNPAAFQMLSKINSEMNRMLSREEKETRSLDLETLMDKFDFIKLWSEVFKNEDKGCI